MAQDPAAILTIPPIKFGCRWGGIPNLGPLLIDGAQPVVTLARVAILMKNGSESYTLDSDAGQSPDAPITITNATTWTITVPAVETGYLPKVGTWNFEIYTYGTGQGKENYIKGTQEVMATL